MPRSSGSLAARSSPASGGAGPGASVLERRRPSSAERRSGWNSPATRRSAPPPPAVEDRVVDRPIVAAPDEDGGAGRPDLLAVADVDERQRPREVDRGARGRSTGRAARSARPNPTASPSRRRPSTSGPHGALDDGGIGHRVVGRSAAGGGLGEVPRGPVAADLADVLLVLEDDAERLVDELRASARARRATGAPPPSRASRRCPGTLVRSASRRRWTKPTTSRASCSGAAGHAGEDDLVLLLGRRVVDPVVQAAALQRVVDLARPVGGEDRPAAAARP